MPSVLTLSSLGVVEMSAKVTALEGFGAEAVLRKKWMRLWEEVGSRILCLPKRERDILLEDFHTAIESRLIVMERITNEHRGP